VGRRPLRRQRRRDRACADRRDACRGNRPAAGPYDNGPRRRSSSYLATVLTDLAAVLPGDGALYADVVNEFLAVDVVQQLAVADEQRAQWRPDGAGVRLVVRVEYRDPLPADFIVGFEQRDDAEQFLAGLRERFAKFGLELHPDKTRLIEFGRHAARDWAARGAGKPETFSFLGFRHICAVSRNGRIWIRRKTEPKRMRAKLSGVNTQIKRRRHLPVPEQGRWLASVVRGHQAYYAVPGNFDAVNAFRTQVAARHWYRALRRRSQRTRLTWIRMNRIVTRWLPAPACCTRSRRCASPPHTQGKSPVR